MRLSEIKGSRVFDVIADIIVPISNIMEDGNAAALFKREKPEDMEPRTYAIQKMRSAVPALVRDHRDDVVAILATLKEVSPEEYLADMSMGSLIGDLYEILTDEDLLAFFS